MAKRLSLHQERKLPKISVSIEPSLADKFKFLCAQNRTSVSKVLQKYIEIYIKKEEDKNAKANDRK